MRSSRMSLSALVVALLAMAPMAGAEESGDPLPSWNDGAAKQAIVAFVERVTRAGGAEFVPAAERVAVFDNDGTLWAEQPLYFQAAFAVDRVRALAPAHPEWQSQEPFKSILAGDVKKALAGGHEALGELFQWTHTGNTTEEFEAVVRAWIATAQHPERRRPYTTLVYSPMLELLAYFRRNGFKTFIVSGGGVEFMRPWVEQVYGVPPEQVVGSRAKVKYEVRDGKPALVRLPEIDFVDDGPGKPVGIHQVIGRRPIAAFGNSDGDFQMLEWTTSGPGPRLGVVVHHTDAEREWAYDRDSHVGRLDKALAEAPARRWLVVDMKKDWKQVFASAGPDVR